MARPRRGGNEEHMRGCRDPGRHGAVRPCHGPCNRVAQQLLPPIITDNPRPCHRQPRRPIEDPYCYPVL